MRIPGGLNSVNIKVSIIAVEKDSIIKSGGHRQLWVAIFWLNLPVRGQIGGTPEKFQKLVVQFLDNI